MRSSAWFRYCICFALSAALVLFCFRVVHVNATTVALLMLLFVLGITTKWGLGEGVFTSVVCAFAFNFYFLPPVGTLTINDPQNWVALAAFLISAVLASQLSARAKSRAEEALARQSEVERLYRLSRVLLMDDETHRIQSALVSIQHIFGLSHVAFYDGETGEVNPIDPSPLLRTHLQQVVQLNETLDENGGTYIPVSLGTRVIGSLGLAGARLTRPEQESITNLVAIGYERLRALNRAAEAEAARRGERLKTAVLDGIAHDLKTPLTAIKTCVTTLITIPPQSEEKRNELLTIIDEEAEHLHKTISEAIQLARIESHKITLNRTVVHLAREVEQLLSTFSKRDRWDVRIAGNLRVSGDADLLAQALSQLIENAVKYSTPDARLEIEAEQDASGTTIKVLDRGPGISPRELERIFDKFYRGATGRAASQGSGMGLAIARGIIEAHGGRIQAANRPGGGSVFTVHLHQA